MSAALALNKSRSHSLSNKSGKSDKTPPIVNAQNAGDSAPSGNTNIVGRTRSNSKNAGGSTNAGGSGGSSGGSNAAAVSPGLTAESLSGLDAQAVVSPGLTVIRYITP